MLRSNFRRTNLPWWVYKTLQIEVFIVKSEIWGSFEYFSDTVTIHISTRCYVSFSPNVSQLARSKCSHTNRIMETHLLLQCHRSWLECEEYPEWLECKPDQIGALHLTKSMEHSQINWIHENVWKWILFIYYFPVYFNDNYYEIVHAGQGC